MMLAAALAIASEGPDASGPPPLRAGSAAPVVRRGERDGASAGLEAPAPDAAASAATAAVLIGAEMNE
jgi:hypothetical protein